MFCPVKESRERSVADRIVWCPTGKIQVVKQARQSLAIARSREEGPDSTEQGDG